MSSRNEPIFGTLWWKLLSSYLLIILVMMILFYFSTTHRMRRFMSDRMKTEVSTRLQKMAQNIQSKYPSTNTLKYIKKDFYELALISGMPMKLIDPDGVVVAEGQFHGPHQHFKASKDEISTAMLSHIKEGAIYSEIQKFGPHNENMYIITYPIFLNHRHVASLLTATPLGPPQGLARNLINVILLTTLCAFIVAFFLAKNFTRPIYKMEKAARRMAQGDFSTRIDLNRKDELGYLATAFDDMSEQLKKNIETRMRLMGDISHELNTPLSNIQLKVSALYDGLIDTEEEKREYLQSILKQIKRFALLINDIKDLSKFEAGEIKINKDLFFAIDPVRRAVESAGMMATARGISLNITADDENLQALGDADRILQALQNLINNAIYHNPPGTKVEVSVREEKDKLMFAVADNGVGIPEDQLENIFERFHKLDKARTTGETCSGLGLSIVREILKGHGEDVYVASSGNGSTFYFYLSKGQTPENEKNG